MNDDQDKNTADNVVDMGLFRMNREQNKTAHNAADRKDSAQNRTNPEQNNTTPTDPPFEIFYDLLSIKAITPDNMPVMMKNMLRSLNSHFALSAQRTNLPEGAGMYNAHIPLTILNFKEEAIEEIAVDFAKTLKEHKPKQHYRITERISNNHKDAPEAERKTALRDIFRTEAIGYTPAYRDLIGKLKPIFPTSSFKPSLIEMTEDGFRPCLCIDAPGIRDRDLRQQIKDYLAKTGNGTRNKNGLKPV